MRTTPWRGRTHVLAVFLFALLAAAPSAQQSVARQWNGLLLESISRDLARPTIHARNLYHTSVAMWDAWATFDLSSKCVLFTEAHPTMSPAIDAMRGEAISYAMYRILKNRFTASPGAAVVLPMYDALMNTLGFNPLFTGTLGNSPAEIGNRIGANMIAYGLADNSNQANGYANQFYVPINPPLIPTLPGNPTMIDPFRWQPLALQYFISQSGVPVPTGYPPFLSPEWGQVKAFALSQQDLSVYERGGFDYWVYHDPGPPPQLGTPTEADFKWSFELVVAWSAHLDPSDGVLIDISPGAIGDAQLPATTAQYPSFYDFTEGGDNGTGHPINPFTGSAYEPQIVPRGDYARVLAEFWADGPASVTPPGHWFKIFNDVAVHPKTIKQIGGVGPVLGGLEWDVKGYLALGGAMHDCAVSCWGTKGWYDFVRPVSAIRYLADMAEIPFHPDAINLHPGLIEYVTSATTAPGQHHAHLAGHEGKIAVKSWRGPSYITNPQTDVAGVGWILADNWWPYQRPTFVSPPFAGYTSGHSTYSRAAAVVMDRFTGSPWFPGGLGEYVCPQNEYLVFEDGPSVTIKLQWGTYYDASDQTSLSRIWGGIHPPCDDVPARKMGQDIGNDAFDRATMFWAGTPVQTAAYSTYGAGCIGSNGNAVNVAVVPSAKPVVGSTMQVKVTNLPASPPAVLMMTGAAAYVPGINLGILGATGCTLDVNIIGFELLTPTAGQATWSVAIPNSPIWLGLSIFHQVATNDPGANPFGLTTSNAGNAVIGL